MKVLDLIEYNNTLLRVIGLTEENAEVIDCMSLKVPFSIPLNEIKDAPLKDEDYLFEVTGMPRIPEEELTNIELKSAYKYFSVIANIIPVAGDPVERRNAVTLACELHHIHRKTINIYLNKYLIFQGIQYLINLNKKKPKPLTKDEKNIRWALNKFYYTPLRNSLTIAYRLMIKHKYTDENGNIFPDAPTFGKFKYFYSKTFNVQNKIISREGLSHYQRNCRPLLGESIQSYAKTIGMGMLDSTLCDIYILNHKGEPVRPYLTACVDAYSGLCCGYALTEKNDTDSIVTLMRNVVTNKKEYCLDFDIEISDDAWPCEEMPLVLITDKGSEYITDRFNGLTQLGVTITELPPYRPELKGSVERFFGIIQNLFKPSLMYQGVVDSKVVEQGAPDYRLSARLTFEEFEKIIIECILHYNSKRVLKNFPFTAQMMTDKVKPFCNEVWNWCYNNTLPGVIAVDPKTIEIFTLPQTKGKYSRRGFMVNDIRYTGNVSSKKYLDGESYYVMYNPDDITNVYLLDGIDLITFDIIEKRFEGMTLEAYKQYKKDVGALKSQYEPEETVSYIRLTDQIDAILNRLGDNDE